MRAVDALVELQAEHDLPAAAIDRIRVETFGRVLSLNNEPAPRSIEAAQYSVPFCLGLAGVAGAGALLPLEESHLVREDAIDLARKVELAVDPAFDAMFSEAVPARVVVTAQGATYEKTVVAPRGEPSNPMSDADLVAKFAKIAGGRAPEGATQLALEALAGLDARDVRPLLHFLRGSRIGAAYIAPPARLAAC